MRSLKVVLYLFAFSALVLTSWRGSMAATYVFPAQISTSGASSNQVLTVVNGTSAWANAGGTTLPQNLYTTSSPTFVSTTLSNFTNGSVVFATSSGSLSQDANFYWDLINHRLGVGTTTPPFPFSVVGTSSIYRSITNAETLRLRQDGDIQQMVNGTFCIRDFSSNCFFSHANTSVLTINNGLSGGVVVSPQMGAGIAFSASSTWTSSSTAITGLFVNLAHGVNQKGTSTTNNRKALDIEVDSKSVFVVHEQGTVGVGTTTPVTLFTVASSTSPNTFFNVADTGNVGVGTSTPSAALHVNGDVMFTGSSTVVTPAIGGALVSGGCDSATTTVDSSISSTTAAFITTPTSNPGTTAGGTWAYSYLLSPGVIQTNVCSNITVTPNTIPYIVKIIR